MAISRTDIAPSTTEQAGLAQLNVDLNTAYDAINTNEGSITTLTATVAGAIDSIAGSQVYLAKGLKAYPGTTPATQVGIEATSLALHNQAITEWVTVSGLSGASALEATITAAGANGLDAGAEAINTWYYMWVATKAAGADPILMFSTSPTWPTMPATYVYGRRVHSVRNDSASDLIPAYREADSDHVMLDTESTDMALLDTVLKAAWANGGSGAPDALATDNYAPPTATTIALEFYAYISNSGAVAATSGFYFRPFGFSSYRGMGRLKVTAGELGSECGDISLKIDEATRDLEWYATIDANTDATSTFDLQCIGYSEPI